MNMHAPEHLRVPLDFDALEVGDSLPPLTLPAISRKTLALYAGASGDHNPLHIDLDYARSMGRLDVFAHGTLSAAYMGRLLTRWIPQPCIRKLTLRFTSITQLYSTPICTGVITEKLTHAGEHRVRIALTCENQYGEKKLAGEAEVAIPALPPRGATESM